MLIRRADDELIAKRKSRNDDYEIRQLIIKELLPISHQRFSHEQLSIEDIMGRLHKGSTYVLKRLNGTVIGFMHLITKNRKLWLDMIAIHRDHQGGGRGKQLMMKAIYEARARNLDMISLFVDESNHKAIKFYKSFGFQPVQYHPNLYCYEYTKQI